MSRWHLTPSHMVQSPTTTSDALIPPILIILVMNKNKYLGHIAHTYRSYHSYHSHPYILRSPQTAHICHIGHIGHIGHICGYTISWNDHDTWSYIYFIDYLNGKDPTELNGVEQYVIEQLHRNEMVTSRDSTHLRPHHYQLFSSETALP